MIGMLERFAESVCVVFPQIGQLAASSVINQGGMKVEQVESAQYTLSIAIYSTPLALNAVNSL
jgi:hypothetical protein